jgi:hypothetical protein
MARPTLKILGSCEIVDGEVSPKTLTPRRVDLAKHRGLHPGDQVVLALLATKPERTRLECIRIIDPALIDATKRFELELGISSADDEAVRAASVRLTKAMERLRKVICTELGIRDPLIVKKARNVKGWVGLDADLLAVDYREVEQVLTRPQHDQPAQAIAKIKGDILQGDQTSALETLRNQFRTDLKSWLAPALPRFSTTDLGRVIDELLATGSSTAYFQKSTGIAVPKRVNGTWQHVAGAPPVDPSSFDVPPLDVTDLSTTACDTMADLLKSWLGGHDYVARRGPSTVVSILPSNWNAIAPVPLKIDIIASPHHPDTVTLGENRYLSVPIGRKQVEVLREFSRAAPSYIALAIPPNVGLAREQLYDLKPAERFDWWLIDAKAYFSSAEASSDEGRVLFPCQNIWNLGLCAVLWASRWVEAFYRPLRLPELDSVPNLVDRINAVYTTDPKRALIMELGWQALNADLSKARDAIDDETFWRVSFGTGLGMAMQLVCGQLEDPQVSDQTEIRTYTPEALYGTVSLWMFSRSYHQFMQLAQAQKLGSSLTVNQRLLPIKGDDPALSSRLHRAALWHVLVLYRMCGVDIRVIPEPADRPGADRAHYGKNIGNYQWASLDADSADWVIDQGEPAVQDEHHQFFLDHAEEALAGRHTSEASFESLSQLVPRSLALSLVKPHWLLPPEDSFIEHPWLWPTPSGRGAARLRAARDGQ